MSKHKYTKAFIRLSQEIVKLPKILKAKDINWFLRNFLVSSRRHLQAGFVLPTTVLLLIVMSLVVAALLARTSSRTEQVIAERQAKAISNAASPAIDRAKAKLEYLFKQDTGLPNGVPGEGKLMELMHNDDEESGYLLGDETRLDINNDGTADNAWSYEADTNGDGVGDATIVYSIIGQIPANLNDLTKQANADVTTRANNLLVRNGSIDSSQGNQNCLAANNLTPEAGWFVSSNNTALLRKNFQINAVVIPDPDKSVNKTITTLELQQDRQLDRANKWGAWFRNDIELNNTPTFNWNGAMHTEGSIFVGETNDFTAYLISSPKSCVFNRTATEITTTEVTNEENGEIEFQGQIVNGSIALDAMLDNTIRFHFIDENNQVVKSSDDTRTFINQARDSISSNFTGGKPSDIALDPVAIFTQDISKASKTDINWSNVRDSGWDSRELFKNKRIYNQPEPKPYVDDTYRADNRYGPKPTYGRRSELKIPTGSKVGNDIDDSLTALTSNDPIVANDPENLGLDGYWERRARLEGLRVIVGQRLELGSPLNPPTSGTSHQARQRRALRDNLAAVQATAIYHQANRDAGGAVQDTPVACLATTAHPGTAKTIERSRTFESITIGGTTTEYRDFFTGRGTNGWEYNVPSSTDLSNSSSSLRKALQNLADFAGDPDGAFPPKQETSGSIIHPHPELTKWGDFSNLRRALKNLETSSYAALSIADKSYIDTAACSLGILADNIKTLQDYSYTNAANKIADSALDGVLKTISATTPDEAISKLTGSNQTLARLIHLKEQVERDRRIGAGSTYSCTASKFNSTNTPNPGAGLVKLCPTSQKYQEALYYIFPIADHAEVRTNTYILSASVNPASLTTRYKGIGIDSTDKLGEIRLKPRTIDTSDPWKLPHPTATFSLKTSTITVAGTGYRVPFIDSGIFNGREMMNVRVLDFDLDLLRNNTYDDDHWLPQTGLIYAFREDAVREDAIARPVATATTTWGSCDTVTELTTATTCKTNAATPQDPPVNPTNGISPKPVDFLPDPDRRPYGFRLRNGADLTRALALNHEDNQSGMSFISDNLVYVQGNFNLHSTDGTAANNLEEFTNTLEDNYSDFYTRTDLNTKFAIPAQDRWRSTEILADAVTILSNNFCDGSIQDSFINSAVSTTTTVPLADYNCVTDIAVTNGVTSYLNQNRPNAAGSNVSSYWRRENTSESTSPIVVDANGSPVRTSGAYSGYYAFSDDKPLMAPIETWVNSIIVSGLVPSRANQYNGGLHNFPRFLENWDVHQLHIAGSLIQLNFSTYATAPWDQESWEPGSPAPTTVRNRKYYNPPNRLWGYDVALQLSPAGPVARRFVTASNKRSEFYQELPAQDPYILNLRCATPIDGEDPIDQSATCP